MQTSVLVWVAAASAAGLSADKKVQIQDLPAPVPPALEPEVAVSAAGQPITP